MIPEYHSDRKPTIIFVREFSRFVGTKIIPKLSPYHLERFRERILDNYY